MPKSASKPKFDEVDRKKVIAEIEEHFGVMLTRVGNHRKFLIDASGKSYWVLGGYDDWHGIPSNVLAEEQRRSNDGVLVVAKRHRTSIDVFVGPLQPLIANNRNLSHTRTGDYQFNVSIRGNIMTIKEIPTITLKKLGPPQEVGIALSAKQKELDAILAKTTPEERKQILEQLRTSQRN